MTTSYKWVAGAVVVALALFAGSWFLLISPKRAEAKDLQDQTAAQEATNAALATERDVLKQQNKTLPEEQAKLAALRTEIPQTVQMPSLVRELDAAADKAGVDFESMTPQLEVPVGGAVDSVDGVPSVANLSAVNTDIVVTGGYFEILRFLNSLENLDRYLLVTKVGMTTPEGEGEVAGASDENAGQLTATLSGRVFVMTDTPVAASVDGGEVPATDAQ